MNAWIIWVVQPARQQEIIIVAFFAIFGLAWAFLAVPYLTSAPWFVALNPVLAYIAYNLGWFFLVTTFFGGLVAFLVFGRSRIIGMLRVGLSSWLFISFVFDNFQPPFYLSPTGQVLIPIGTSSLENEAVDAMLAYVWGHFIPNVLITVNLYLTSGIVSVILLALSVFFARRRRRSAFTMVSTVLLAVVALSAFAYLAGVPGVQSVSLLYIFTYPVSAFLAVLAMALLLAPKKFVKLFYNSL